MGYRNMSFTIDCLTFADDHPEVQISQLKVHATKAGLKICIEKTEFITIIKSTPRELEIEKIKRTEKL